MLRQAAMWCSSCRQDVPGVTSPVDGKQACPRCGMLVGIDAGMDLADFTPEILAEAQSTVRVPPRAEMPDFKPAKPPRGEPARTTSLRWEAANWELNEKLRHVERITATARRYDEPSATAGAPHFGVRGGYRPLRSEAEPPAFAPPPRQPYAPPPYAPQYPSPHSPDGPQDPYAPSTAPQPQPHEWNRHDDDYDDAPPHPGVQAAMIVSWIFLGLATTAFSCGAFLTAWGAVAERPPLQQLGMPIVLAGVLALVVGVLPQVMLRSLEEERRRRETLQRAERPTTTPAAHRAAPSGAERRAA